MPKPSIRGSELPQRQSPRLRSSSTSSDPHHLTHRSSNLGLDRRSPRSGGPHSDPLSQKKLGGRISGLESQLGHAQEELRLLKEQLAKAEAAKKRAQEELHKKKPKKSKSPAPVESERDHIPGDGHHQETDVFEVVPVENVKESDKTKNADMASKEDQINVLKARLYDLEKEKVSLSEENESLKNQLKKTDSEMSSAKAKEDEIASKVNQIGEELEESNENTAKLKKKLESMEDAKESLEAEMKKLKVQTEQWRKAADAAAAVLAGGVEMNGRCGSMENHFAGRFVGSPGMADDFDELLGIGKRKGSGMKMFGDLWRKKGQK